MQMELKLEMPHPDFVYDPEDWDYTLPYRDWDLLTRLQPGQIKMVSTLIKGPARYIVSVPVNGYQIFDNLEDAKAAANGHSIRSDDSTT